MVHEAHQAGSNETGGLLVGYAEMAAVVVTRVVGPGPQATHTPHSFQPDYAFHESMLEEIHAESGGVEGYLGDWHTHPDGSLHLSRKDLAVLRQIAQHPDSGLAHPLMLILTTQDPPEAAVWRYRKRLWRPPVEACEIIIE